MRTGETYRDLRVYKQAFELQQDKFLLSKPFPVAARYALTDQIRRASRSIGANIAEAWHKRRSVAHFVSKRSDADTENAEKRHWLDTARECGSLTPEIHRSLEESSLAIGKMLGSMLANPDPLCRSVYEK